ncbi:hypothetical protein CP6013_04024 [Clostridium pasteurianum DSM 525 = ATCC 6013]|uniref:Uncharacterized protein n=1 Tax=Clostridium pasteurianum DSM 525 = ATCC 6013 TaxID=1262449 RepID=A0A837S4H9_CLOPA|nr:hypothetical protein [Clostridium pasteurianum]KRU10732.1 hypothetical protein CP6013_04024 [Clostridium pasteurianum DSM 525 = ATCC 6013]
MVLKTVSQITKGAGSQQVGASKKVENKVANDDVELTNPVQLHSPEKEDDKKDVTPKVDAKEDKAPTENTKEDSKELRLQRKWLGVYLEIS